MTCARDVLARCAVLDGQRSLGDHLAGVGSDDVHAEDTVSLRIRDELNQAFRVQVRLGARVGAEREGAHIVLDTSRLDLGLVLADPGDLRVGVHDTRDRAVVDVSVALLDVFDRRDGLLLGFVCKHRAERAVTDHADVRVLGPVFLIDHEATLFVHLQANVLEPEAGRVRATANGDENHVRIKGLLLSALDTLNVDSNRRTAVITAEDLGVGEELDSLLRQDLLGLLGDFGVHTRAANLAQILDDGDFGTEARPHGGLHRLACSRPSVAYS